MVLSAVADTLPLLPISTDEVTAMVTDLMASSAKEVMAQDHHIPSAAHTPAAALPAKYMNLFLIPIINLPLSFIPITAMACVWIQWSDRPDHCSP